MVERVSGKTMREFAQERIFGPLGMTSTQYLDNHTLVIPRRAASYRPGPDGGILTTVEDLAKWDQNFYDPKVGGPGLIEQLQTTGVLNSGEKIDYARGLNVDEYRGLRRVSHNGGWVAFVSVELAPLGPDRFAAVDFPVPLETSFSTSPDGLREVRVHLPNDVLVFQSVEPASLSAADRAGLAGTYFSEELGVAYTLAVEEGNLLLKYANRLPARVLQPAFADAFTAPGIRLLQLTRDSEKKVTGFTIRGGRIRDIGFTRTGA